MAGKAVATKQGTAALAVSDAMMEDANAGFEEADINSYAVPFMTLLQKMSPQVDEAESSYIDGAKPGMIANSVTEELYDAENGVNVVPCHYRRTYIEWKPRDAGGGFVADHGVDAGAKLHATTKRDEKTNRDFLPNGNYLVETHSFFVQAQAKDGSWLPAMLNMSSTQGKVARTWMTKMRNIKRQNSEGKTYNQPMFGSVWNLKTTLTSNDKGSWFLWKPTHDRQLNDAESDQLEMILNAKAFREDVVSNVVDTTPQEEIVTEKVINEVEEDAPDFS